MGREALLSGGPYKAAVAMFPEYMRVGLMYAAYKAAAGEELPKNYESGTVVITQDNFADFYTQDGDNYITDFDANGTPPEIILKDVSTVSGHLEWLDRWNRLVMESVL